jgi:hypothetical protein
MAVIDVEGADQVEDVDEVEEVDDPREGSTLGVLVSEHPLAALGGALAVGYLLGGGLATRGSRHLLRRGFQLAMQLSLLPQYEDDVAELATRLGRTVRRAADAYEGAASPDDDDSVDFSQESASRDL